MTQLTVEKIYPMAEGAKSGGLKATDGKTYKFLPWQAKFINVGETLDVPITESEYNGNTYRWLAKTWPPQGTQNAARPQPAPAAAAPASAPQATGGGCTDRERQGYILTSVLIKILADAQNASGKTVDTQDLPLLADAAVAVVRDKILGKF